MLEHQRKKLFRTVLEDSRNQNPRPNSDKVPFTNSEEEENIMWEMMKLPTEWTDNKPNQPKQMGKGQKVKTQCRNYERDTSAAARHFSWCKNHQLFFIFLNYKVDCDP